MDIFTTGLGINVPQRDSRVNEKISHYGKKTENAVKRSSGGDWPYQDPKYICIDQRKIQIQSSEQFRQELFQIREYLSGLLGSETLTELDTCRKHLETLIKSDESVLRYGNSLILAVNKSGETKKITEKINDFLFRIKEFIDHTINCAPRVGNLKERFTFLLLLCRHYKFENEKSMIEKILGSIENNSVPDKSTINLNKEYTKNLELRLPHYIFFDIIMEGNFDKGSGLFFVIYEKVQRSIYLSPRDIVNDSHYKLSFDFDDSTNVRLMWALFSLFEYWNYQNNKFLTLYTQALNDQRNINLRNDNSFINYICMRISSTNQIDDLFDRRNREYIEHVKNLEINKKIIHASASERAIYSLKTFVTSPEMTSGRIKDSRERSITTLYDFFYEKACIDKLTRFLLNEPVHPQRVIENFCAEIEESLKKQKYLSKAIEELKKITREQAEMLISRPLLKQVAEQSKQTKLKADKLEQKSKSLDEQSKTLSEKKIKEIQEINKKSKSLVVNIASTKASLGALYDFTNHALEVVIDPINFTVIERAVILTTNGDTYDKTSIMQYISKEGICPITRKQVSEAQLVPNLALQRLIDALPPEVKEKINSGIEEVEKLINTEPSADQQEQKHT